MDVKKARQVALFFFFATLDEDLAVNASKRAVILLKKLANRSKGQEGEDLASLSDSQLVYVTQTVYHKIKSQISFSQVRVTGHNGWVLPDGLNLNHWKEYRKSAEEEEVLAFIWAHVLGISDVDIAQGLGVTNGTVRFRLSRAAKQLGHICSAETYAS